MQYIIYGAGNTGRKALYFLGFLRVECFATTEKENDSFEMKPVISYSEMLIKEKEGYCIVVASYKYSVEMARKLEEDGARKFFIFNDNDPVYIRSAYPCYYLYRRDEVCTYTRVLSWYGIYKYKRIAIYGDNYYLPYLVSEIAIQNDYDNIIGFIQTSKNIKLYSMGISNVDVDRIWDEIDCLIVNLPRSKTDIFDKLAIKKHSFDVINMYDIDRFIPEFYHADLERYKDLHKGSRCFIIGNGSSLSVNDLNKIHNNGDICFAFNFIYKIYDETNWRPTYYCCSDFVAMSSISLEAQDLGKTVFFTDEYNRANVDIKDNVIYIHLNREKYYPNSPNFSDDLKKVTYTGCTCVYEMGMQLAAYMGFKDIYLLGVDHDYEKNQAAINFRDDYLDKDNEFLKVINTIQDGEKNFLAYTVPSMTKAYQFAEKYSRDHGFRIFNATRGGDLNVFERVNFDDLF